MCSQNAEGPAPERKGLFQAFKRRVIRSALFQPSPLLFVVCLFLLAGCLPLLATYVDRTSRLPDLDTMKVHTSLSGSVYYVVKMSIHTS